MGGRCFVPFRMGTAIAISLSSCHRRTICECEGVVLSDAEVRSRWRRVALSVNALQDMAGFDAGDIRWTCFEHVQEHPSVFPVNAHIAQRLALIVCWGSSSLGRRMVKDRVARLEFRQELPHAVLECPHVTVEQFGGTLIDVLRPSTVIDIGDVDVVRQHALLD